MHQLLRSVFLTITLVFSTAVILAQVTITGSVRDKGSDETMIGTNVVIKGTTTGTTTDIDGKFSLEVDSLPVTIQISFVGFGKKEITVTDASTPLNIEMEMAVFAGQEIVVSASRVAETIMESAIAVQKMNSKEIREAASGDFYQDLGTMQGVDVTSASMGFKVVNSRGFNDTSPVRSVQMIDGMDNQAPGLNFPVGNLLGASELDLEGVEIISGPASAMYGPSAMQGVISMTTKDPFKYPGLSAQVKGGSNSLLEGQFRYANVLDASGKWGIKLNFTHFQAIDWEATDSIANKYGDIELEDFNLTSVLRKSLTELEDKKEKNTLTPEESEDLVNLTKLITGYLDVLSPAAWPGDIDIQAPGYYETQLAKDNATKSTRIGASLFYKVKDSLMLSYEYKYGLGTAIYQGTNRYSINNIRFNQHKLELKGKNFFLRGYTTIENAGDSYDIKFTGINLSKGAIPDYVSEYLSAYFDSTAGLKVMTNGFDDEADPWMVDSAHRYAAAQAAKMWYKVGTARYDSAYAAIVSNSDLANGSKFVDASSLQHFEGQYNFDFDFANVIAGASFRRYDPNSFGTIFEDTLANPGDTLADGQNDFDAEFVNVGTYEYGSYVQASKRFMGDKLKLAGSLRFDASKNYDPQLSPRLSAVYTQKDHNFRIAAQSAFRSPTLQNQYLLIDLGVIKLNGNLNGSGNLAGVNGDPIPFYTLESARDFIAMSDSVDANGVYIGEIQPQLLETIILDPIKPEQVKTIEIGYRGILGKIYVDWTAYYSIYNSFIGNIRVALPDGTAVAGEESGEDAVVTGNSQAYQIPINAKQEVVSYGSSIGLAYHIKNYKLKANYTYAVLDTSNLTDPIIPGFNTPRNKYNVGVIGTRVWKDMGFSINYKWVEGFRWESSFGDGDISGYDMLDVQLSYEFKDLYSTLRVGASNALNNRHTEAYGAVTVGRLIYATWSFHFDEF